MDDPGFPVQETGRGASPTIWLILNVPANESQVSCLITIWLNVSQRIVYDAIQTYIFLLFSGIFLCDQ